MRKSAQMQHTTAELYGVQASHTYEVVSLTTSAKEDETQSPRVIAAEGRHILEPVMPTMQPSRTTICQKSFTLSIRHAVVM